LQLYAATIPRYDYNKRTENSELFEVMNILTKITELFPNGTYVLRKGFWESN
jgi:hypothetical protein